MRTPDPQTCEVKIDGAWLVASLAEAGGTYRSALKRCPACHGPVAINGNYAGKIRPHPGAPPQAFRLPAEARNLHGHAVTPPSGGGLTIILAVKMREAGTATSLRTVV